MTRFGTTPDGRDAHLFTLQNPHGFRAEITNYGGTIVRLFAPDGRGTLGDVALGFDSLAAYVAHSPYFGCIIGRCGNRIAKGRFSLEGKTYTLATNNAPGGIPCHLHGGLRGFDKVLWTAEPATSAAGESLRLSYRSVDGEEGYPGNLDVVVTYTVTADNALRIDYTASADAPTPVNLTNHCYFNLAGHDRGDVLGHVVQLNATRYTPVDAGLIPLGTIAPVADTPLDFTQPRAIGERIDEAHEQLRFAGGYDHNFVLDGVVGPALRAGLGASARDAQAGSESQPHHLALAPAAAVFEPQSRRVLEVLTTEPGVQFYSGNFLDGSFRGKGDHVYQRRAGFCLETQHFPDSPNQPAFPSVILRPGETLSSTTVYRFSVR